MFSFIATRSAIKSVVPCNALRAGTVSSKPCFARYYSSTKPVNDPVKRKLKERRQEASAESKDDTLEHIRTKNKTAPHSSWHQGTSPLEDFDAPGWREELASPSEAFIKADHYTGPTSPADLQQETLAHLKKLEAGEGTVRTKKTVTVEKTNVSQSGERETVTETESEENLRADRSNFVA